MSDRPVLEPTASHPITVEPTGKHVTVRINGELVADTDKALTLQERWQAPSLPIGGNDVMALGELKGPEVGELLKVLEQDWIASGFALGRDELLAKARGLIAAWG